MPWSGLEWAKCLGFHLWLSPPSALKSSELLPFRPCSEPLLAPVLRHRGLVGMGVLGESPPHTVLPELSQDSLGGRESGRGRSVRAAQGVGSWPQLCRRPAGTRLGRNRASISPKLWLGLRRHSTPSTQTHIWARRKRPRGGDYCVLGTRNRRAS